MTCSRTAFAAALAGVMMTSAAPLAQAPNPLHPYIDDVTYGGSGCPQGTVGRSFSNDRLSFTLIFDEFIATTGPGLPLTDSRKNCQVNVQVRVPAGSGDMCVSIDYRGYVNLPSGTSGEQSAEYFWQLPDPIGSRTSPFDGPINKDYLSRDEIQAAWNTTDAEIVPFNVNSQVRLIGPAANQALMTTDSIDGKLMPGPCPTNDTEPPVITVAQPVSGGRYGLNAAVPASFTCTDTASGVASCDGPAALDTSSVGPKSLAVTATDLAGNTSSTTVHYSVGGKEECKAGGHAQFLVPAFRNQGLCVSSFARMR